MADTQRIAVRLFLIVMGVALLGLIGLGVLYLAGPQEQTVTSQENLDSAVTTGSEAQRMDTLREGLHLANHQLDQGRDVVSGSVVNNSRKEAYVGVRIAFSLLDAKGKQVGTVSDTTSEVGPGETWRFNLALPADVKASQAELTKLTGGARPVKGASPSDTTQTP